MVGDRDSDSESVGEETRPITGHADEVKSAVDKHSSSFDLWVLARYLSQEKWNRDQASLAWWQGQLSALYRAFEEAHGQVVKSFFCSEFLSAVAITLRDPPRRFPRLRRWIKPRRRTTQEATADRLRGYPELHILFNILDAALADEESVRLADLIYECKRLALKANELLSGPDLFICLDLIYWVFGEATARLNEKLIQAGTSSPDRADGAPPPNAEGPTEEGTRKETKDAHPVASPREIGHPPPGVPRTGPLYENMRALWKMHLDDARSFYLRSAKRGSEISYLKGMAVGLLALLMVGVLGGLILARAGKLPLRLLVVSFIGGAIGATVSVLTRMTRGDLKLNYETGRRYLSYLGAFRPLIGCLFGLFVFFVLESGLLRVQPPRGGTNQFFFFAAFSFVAGFSERFAQDILGRVEEGLPPGMAPRGGPQGAPSLGAGPLPAPMDPPADRPPSSP